MANIFENYQNIPNDYTPNNLIKVIEVKETSNKLVSCLPNKPHEIYNIKDELIGYGWNYGDTISLQFQLIGKFDTTTSPIYYIVGQENTDLPEGERTLVSAEDFVKGRTVRVRVFNFRAETVFEQWREGNALITLNITDDFYNKIPKGVYYLVIDVIGETKATIFNMSDCILMIK